MKKIKELLVQYRKFLQVKICGQLHPQMAGATPAEISSSPPETSTESPGGEPCNGCGFCCVKSPCALAVNMYDLSSFYGGATLPCPALSWDGERHICANAERYWEELNIGKGCRNPHSWWRDDVRCRLQGICVARVEHKEEECPCPETSCKRHGDCVACCKHYYFLDKRLTKRPFCKRPENAVSDRVHARVLGRLIPNGLGWILLEWDKR